MSEEKEKEQETDPQKLKQLEKQRLKEEKKRQAQKDEEERKYNLRKDFFAKELNYYDSVKHQIKSISDYTAKILKTTIIGTEKEQFWGCLKLNNEWKDFHCNQLLEDVKGRIEGEDIVNHLYLESFDQIMGSYQEIMLQMMNEFELRRDKMLKNHWAFLKYAKLKGMEVRDDVRTVSYGTSDRYERKCQLLARRQRKYRLKVHNKRLDDIAETAYDLETKAFNLWVQFRTVFGRFRKDWKLARRLVFFLKLKDAEGRKEIAQQKRFFQIVESMKKSTGDSGKHFWIEKNKDLAEERAQYANDVGNLQHKFKENMKFDETKISHLSSVSLSIIKKLEDIKEKVEKVLQLKRMCFKFETEEEKIFPSEYVEMYKPIMREEFDSVFCVDKLTYRTTMVKNHVIMMEGKLQKLKIKNANLMNKLKYFLSQLRPTRDIEMTMQCY